MLDHAIFIRGACRIQTHLKIFVIHFNLMKGKFQIRKYTDTSLFFSGIFYIPDLHRIIHGNRKSLRSLDSAVLTFIYGIGHTVSAGIFCLIQRFSHRLPGNTPIVSAFIISQIHIMSRPIHGHPIPTKPCDPVIFRRLIKNIPSCCMIDHSTHIVHSQIIGPGYRKIDPVNDIFSFFIIKMPVLHKKTSHT